jgi:A/G-specific adenine glycosylase
VASTCVARAQGRPERYPVKTRKLKRGARRNAMLWLVDPQQRLWLTQRAATGVWAGLWTLPLFESLDGLRSLTADWPGRAQALPPIDHVLTHFDWRLEPWRHALPARLSSERLAAIEQALGAGRWCSPDQASSLGLPAPVRKLLQAY